MFWADLEHLNSSNKSHLPENVRIFQDIDLVSLTAMVSVHLVRERTKVLFVDSGEVFNQVSSSQVFQGIRDEVRMECFYEGFAKLENVS